MIYFTLKQAILESGLKQGFIAKQVGLAPNLFSKKLNGYRPMRQEEKEELAKILGRKISDLFPAQNEGEPSNA